MRVELPLNEGLEGYRKNSTKYDGNILRKHKYEDDASIDDSALTAVTFVYLSSRARVEKREM